MVLPDVCRRAGPRDRDDPVLEEQQSGLAELPTGPSGIEQSTVLVPVAEAGPARWFAASGAVAEIAASRLMERRLGLVREAYRTGRAHRLRMWAEALTAAGLAGTTLAAGRSRAGAVASGIALLAGSALARFGVFEAGIASTKDPKYVVVPQRQRIEERRASNRPQG